MERNGSSSLFLVTTGIDRTTVKSSLLRHEILRIPVSADFFQHLGPRTSCETASRPKATRRCQVGPSLRHGRGTHKFSGHALAVRIAGNSKPAGDLCCEPTHGSRRQSTSRPRLKTTNHAADSTTPAVLALAHSGRCGLLVPKPSLDWARCRQSKRSETKPRRVVSQFITRLSAIAFGRKDRGLTSHGCQLTI